MRQDQKEVRESQQLLQPEHISEMISQTIKEQVSKGIQEILQSVTQITQQQLMVQSPYSKRSGFNHYP